MEKFDNFSRLIPFKAFTLITATLLLWGCTKQPNTSSSVPTKEPGSEITTIETSSPEVAEPMAENTLGTPPDSIKSDSVAIIMDDLKLEEAYDEAEYFSSPDAVEYEKAVAPAGLGDVGISSGTTIDGTGTYTSTISGSTSILSGEGAVTDGYYAYSTTESVMSTSSSEPRALKSKDRLRRDKSSSPPPAKKLMEISEVTEHRAMDYEDAPAEMSYATDEVEYEELAEEVMDFEKEYGDAAVKPKAGTLTAGEVNDFTKWELWQDIDSTDLAGYSTRWSMNPKERYMVQLTNNLGSPVIDGQVQLIGNGGKTLWRARTDNTGKAELWAGLYNTPESIEKIRIVYRGTRDEINDPVSFHEGVNTLQLNATCQDVGALDIAFVVDATGSMGDEINYLKSELGDVISRAKSTHKDLNLRLGTVFYRDETDSYVTRTEPFSEDHNKIVSFINNQTHGGGGDFPEAVDKALDAAINGLEWSEEARARLLFLVLDAPPHEDENSKRLVQEATTKAAEKGIRIIPITASGIDKSTEYLMRSMALATNGTYVFLTDDSGVGNPHIKPTTDEFSVEFLNDLILRLIAQFTEASTCEEVAIEIENNQNSKFSQDTLTLIQPIDTSDENGNNGELVDDPCENPEITIYPNPTFGEINLETNCQEGELFIADMNGKILYRVLLEDIFNGRRTTADIRSHPSGTYILRYQVRGKTRTEKILKLN